MKLHLLFGLSLASASCFAQNISSSPPTLAVTQQQLQTFDQAYWASQPPAVQQLENTAASARATLAVQLARAGYQIDEVIMVWGWDPYTTMATRQLLGYTWIPTILQSPIGADPGYAVPGVPPLPGQTAYPVVAPAGSIAVSTVTSAYPPYSLPVPVAPAPPMFSLGPQIAANEYLLMTTGEAFPAIGSQLAIGTVSGTVVKVGPFAFGLQTGN